MPLHSRQRYNQSADYSDEYEDYILPEPYPSRQQLNHTRTPWRGVGQSRRPGNHPVQRRESEFEELLQANRELQEELARVKATVRELQTENLQLQQELDIERNTNNDALISSTVDSKPPLDQMLEEAKPHIRKLVMLYYPFVAESTKLGPKPPSGTLSPAVRFAEDVNRRPSQGDLFLAQLYRCLPDHLHDLVTGHTKFKATFSKTAKNMKGHIVEELRKAAPLIIKGVESAYFASKGDRSDVKQLIALLSWERRKHVVDFLAPILYPREVRAKKSVEGYKRFIFQSPELFLFIRALLFGQSSLGGKVSKKSYGNVWGITGVESLDSTIIPVFAVLVLCIISEDTEVAAVGARTKKKWQLLLEAYLGEFYKLKERKKEEYYRVMDLFEAIVFDKTPERREEEEGLESLNLFEESAIFEDDEAEVSWRNEVLTLEDSLVHVHGEDDFLSRYCFVSRNLAILTRAQQAASGTTPTSPSSSQRQDPPPLRSGSPTSPPPSPLSSVPSSTALAGSSSKTTHAGVKPPGPPKPVSDSDSDTPLVPQFRFHPAKMSTSTDKLASVTQTSASHAPTVSEGLLTVDTLRAFETCSKRFFRAKKIAAEDQVAQVIFSFEGHAVQDWVNILEAELVALSFSAFMGRLRTKWLRDGWDYEYGQILHGFQGDQVFSEWVNRIREANSILVSIDNVHLPPERLRPHIRMHFNTELDAEYRLVNGEKPGKLDTIVDLEDWITSVSRLDQAIKAKAARDRKAYIAQLAALGNEAKKFGRNARKPVKTSPHEKRKADLKAIKTGQKSTREKRKLVFFELEANSYQRPRQR
ncbi:hypothetical protein FPV67DRAFT_1448996 [Lyophyllum atratum]|nr:hypothetical protein FPV67DRAFT_1448996 [Lyophyllum atratum]